MSGRESYAVRQPIHPLSVAQLHVLIALTETDSALYLFVISLNCCQLSFRALHSTRLRGLPPGSIRTQPKDIQISLMDDL